MVKGDVVLLIIYKATNLVNNKKYIGQTINSLEYRKQQHFREARNPHRRNYYFHNAINKYGEDNFIFEQIDLTNTQKELDEKERYWIKYYNSNNKNHGYNLDSGGKSGGAKSDECKKKIGETTKEKWRNPDIARKMRYGLQKGVETMKANTRKYPFRCPICNKVFYYEKNVADKKKYCSQKCATRSGSWRKGVNASAEQSHKRNIEKKQTIRKDIIEWALDNQGLVLSCPYNKISTTLIDLKTLIKDKYDIKDWRTIFICFDCVHSLKSLLDKLKNIIYISKENVC